MQTERAFRAAINLEAWLAFNARFLGNYRVVAGLICGVIKILKLI